MRITKPKKRQIVAADARVRKARIRAFNRGRRHGITKGKLDEQRRIFGFFSGRGLIARIRMAFSGNMES